MSEVSAGPLPPGLVSGVAVQVGVGVVWRVGGRSGRGAVWGVVLVMVMLVFQYLVELQPLVVEQVVDLVIQVLVEMELPIQAVVGVVAVQVLEQAVLEALA